MPMLTPGVPEPGLVGTPFSPGGPSCPSVSSRTNSTSLRVMVDLFTSLQCEAAGPEETQGARVKRRQEPRGARQSPTNCRHAPVTECFALQLQCPSQQCLLAAVLIHEGLMFPRQVLMERAQASVFPLQGLVGCHQLLVLELRVLLCERSERGALGAQSGIFHLPRGRRG